MSLLKVHDHVVTITTTIAERVESLPISKPHMLKHYGMKSAVVHIAVIGAVCAAVVSLSNGLALSVDEYDNREVVEFENDEVAEMRPTWQQDETICNLRLSNKTVKYWKSVIGKYEPNFIHFNLRIHGVHISAKEGAFMPHHWVWTFKSQQGLYPYLNWNLDFNLTSFGLLDAKTLHVSDNTYVLLIATPQCNLTFGEQSTTQLIAEQLLQLTINLTDSNPQSMYDESYWCFLAEAPGFRDTIEYKFGQYLLYPVSVLNYNCCQTYFKYTNDTFQVDCPDRQMAKWSQCTIIPYILGIILFLYFPLVMLNMSGLNCESILRDVTNTEQEHEHLVNELDAPTVFRQGRQLSDNESHLPESNDWLFLDGKHPKTVSDVLTKPLWFMASYPIVTSRLKRFTFLLLLPIVVYIKVYAYYIYQPYVTKKLVKFGVPMGMLSILGDEKDYVRVFVPLFKGPVVMWIMYHIFGLLFLVLPNSLKHVVNLGVPHKRIPDTNKITMFCFTPSEVISMSRMQVGNAYGAITAAEYIGGGIYMLFTGSFWRKVIEIQIQRFMRASFGVTRLRQVCYWAIFLPLYILLCGIELIVCLLYYGIPFIAFISIMIKGALKVVMDLNASHFRRGSCLDSIFSSRVIIVLGTTGIAVCFLLFTYSYCLIFIESFTFLSEVFVFCFVAVVVYPSVAFGYLFFFVVLIYYIFHLFHSFGNTYLELLSEAVEVSVNKEGFQNQVTYYNGKLDISNVTNSNITGLCINDVDIPMPDNAFHAVTDKMHTGTAQRKVIFRNSTYGIRRDLFDHLVEEFCPVHLQILTIVSQLGLITFILVFLGSLAATMFIGPSSEISDVMHVVFIITIGALPRVLEVAMSNSGEHVKRDIKLRRLEQSISGYWESRRSQESHDLRT